MNKRAALIVVAGALALIGVLIYTSLGLKRYTVEVCMEYAGMRSCRTASAETKELALRAAISNACSLISSGVTGTMACEREQPVKVEWK
jgi:hypothetical protein